MKAYRIVFAPEAEDDLAELHRYLVGRGAAMNAQRYVDAIVDCCEALATLPHQGHQRSDVRPGLRLTHHRGRTVIAFAVDDEARQVAILRVLYGGRDSDAALTGDPGEPPSH